MAGQKKQDESSLPKRRRATTSEERERQLAAMAYDLAEEQLRDGTVSAQVQMHFLKAVSRRSELEEAKIKMEIELGKVKQDAIAAAAKQEELFAAAIQAMQSYSTDDRTPEE